MESTTRAFLNLDSGDMESSEEESDHIDGSGPSSPYTWTQPSSPRPPLAIPPVPPAAPVPNELTRPCPDHFTHDNLGRHPYKRAKSAADALLNTGSTVTQAISIDSDSGDMESSEEESDHIDDSGPSTPYTKSDYQRYTWTQPSSPKPPPASPTAPSIVSAPNETTLLSPDYLAPYNESYDSDYGAGLSSASDHDDPKMESQVTAEKQRSAMESCNEMNTAVEKQNSSYSCCSPSQCSQIIDLTNDDSDSDFINRTQARRTQVDGQSATHNDDDSDSDVTVLQARRTQVNGQSAALNDDDANVSSAEYLELN